MKPIRLTRHARNRMRWRRVTLDEVESVLRGPARVEATRFGRSNAYGEVSDRLLKVTYIEEADGLVVISVVTRTSGPRT